MKWGGLPGLLAAAIGAMLLGAALCLVYDPSAHGHVHGLAFNAETIDRSEPLAVAGLHRRATAIAIATDISSHACTALSGQFAYLQHQIDPRTQHLVTIVFDPAIRTDADLRRYAGSLGDDPARWTIRRGTDGDRALAARMGIAIEAGGTAHVERTAIVGRSGFVASIVESRTPGDVADALAAFDRPVVPGA